MHLSNSLHPAPRTCAAQDGPRRKRRVGCGSSRPSIGTRRSPKHPAQRAAVEEREARVALMWLGSMSRPRDGLRVRGGAKAGASVCGLDFVPIDRSMRAEREAILEAAPICCCHLDIASEYEMMAIRMATCRDCWRLGSIQYGCMHCTWPRPCLPLLFFKQFKKSCTHSLMNHQSK